MSNHFGKMTKRGVSLIYTWSTVWLLLWNSTGCLEIRNNRVWCYCGPQCRTSLVDLCMMSLLSALKHSTMLFESFCVLPDKYGTCFSFITVPATKPHLIGCAGGYSVAPRWTWAQPQSARCSSYFLCLKHSLKSWKVHIDQVICWHGIALSCEKASWLQLSAVMLRYQ